MQRTRGFRCLLLTLVLALLLAAPWPVAAQPSEPSVEVKASPIHLFLAWLEGLWVDAGCIFDPSGVCRDGLASESPFGNEGLDNGCSFDPSGGGCRDEG